MPIATLGSVNVSALSVPQALIQIVPPQYLYGGASNNSSGLVGTASWGPVNLATDFGSYSQYAQTFGPTINRTYDMGAHVILAQAQGAQYFYGVRITDGTDTAATIAVLTNCITFTGKYTGTLGNSVNVVVGPGTQQSSSKVVVYNSYLGMEVFDNLAQGLSGNAAWVAIAAAINNGSSATRPASNIIVASAGAGVTAVPTTATTYTLTGGTDGVTTITTAKFLGTDTLPRSGMYALRGTPIARFGLCDCSDSTSWSSQLAFAISISAQAISCTPASDTLATAATELNTAGIDSPWIKVIFGDWVIWLDSVNGVPTRMSSPIGVAIGIRGNLSPEESILNKPINGIVGTQASLLNKTYSYADFQALAAARLDIIALDPSLTNNFIFRLGLNTSSNPITHDDAYTDVTNWLAQSTQTIANQYIGKTTTQDSLRQSKVALQTFLALAQTNGIIGTFDGSQAYQVVSDTSNNTQATVALGYRYAYVKAIYLGITRFFIVNLEGGASVTISDTLPGQ